MSADRIDPTSKRERSRTSSSACSIPHASSGRSRSSPLQTELLPAEPWRTSRTVRVGAAPRANRSSTSRSVSRLSWSVGLREREPAQIVDLAGGREGALLGLHRPPAHDLRPHAGAVALDVAGLAQPAPDPNVESGLLEDLADGALEVGLAGRDLALRQAPVVVARPMDDRDLDPRLPVDALDPSPHDAAGGANGRADHIAHFRQRRRRISGHSSRNARIDSSARDAQALDEAAGLERVARAGAARREGLANQSLRDGGVLDVAEQVLERRPGARRGRRLPRPPCPRAIERRARRRTARA